MKPIAFFDLDGTLRSTGSRLYPRAEDVSIYPGVPERLRTLRQAGYLLVGVTNQGGVATGAICAEEVQAAIDRTQHLLGEAALDLALYCPHHKSADGIVCDCKKPAPGLILNALSRLQGTLDGAFVVGDDPHSDAGLAKTLDLPFIDAHRWLGSFTADLLFELFSPGSSRERISPNMDRALGAIVGMAVGDALGAPLEFQTRKSVRRKYPDGLREMIASGPWRKGQYTDDTEMALLIAESLIANLRLVPNDIAERFHRWAETAQDVGIQTRNIVNEPGYADSPEQHAQEYYRRNPRHAAGNGAVMRCAPVALFWLQNLPMLLADSRRSARITHGDPKAQASCVLVNACLREAILHGVRDARSIAREYLTHYEHEDWNRLWSIESLPEDEISSSGYTIHTVEAAFWSFLTTKSFEEAVVLTANLGDDADTVAAVTGALAGAYYGLHAIPERWRSDLENTDELIRIGSALLAYQFAPGV